MLRYRSKVFRFVPFNARMRFARTRRVVARFFSLSLFFSTWRRGNNPCHRFRHIFLSFFFSFPFLFFSSLFFFPSRRLIVDSRISLARSIRADSKSSTCVAFLISVKFRPPDLRVNVRWFWKIKKLYGEDSKREMKSQIKFEEIEREIEGIKDSLVSKRVKWEFRIRQINYLSIIIYLPSYYAN